MPLSIYVQWNFKSLKTEEIKLFYIDLQNWKVQFPIFWRSFHMYSFTPLFWREGGRFGFSNMVVRGWEGNHPPSHPLNLFPIPFIIFLMQWAQFLLYEQIFKLKKCADPIIPIVSGFDFSGHFEKPISCIGSVCTV